MSVPPVVPPRDAPVRRQDPSAPPSYDEYGLMFDMNWDEQASMNLKGVLERLNISDTFSRRLRSIQGCRIVFILDDSGSMNSPSDDQKVDEYGSVSGGVRMTRWEELQQFVRDAVDIYGDLSLDGVDFYFLNRGPVLNVKVFDQIAPAFHKRPERNDLTPLSQAVQLVLRETRQCDAKKVVVNIVTDGSPRSVDNSDSLEHFRQILSTIPQRVYVNIRLCTDNESIVKTYNKIDTGLARIDVNDDYQSEFHEVHRRKHIKMTRGEYLLKCTIGAADDTKGKENFDRWDEKKKCIVM